MMDTCVQIFEAGHNEVPVSGINADAVFSWFVVLEINLERFPHGIGYVDSEIRLVNRNSYMCVYGHVHNDR